MIVYQRTFKPITVVLLYCFINVFIFSHAPMSIVSAQTAPPAPAGILRRVSGSVLLNGNPATEGATVLSGAQIQSVNNSSATIDLGGLGRVEIGCSTTVKLTFGADRVETTVVNGFARLSANRGISGTLITPEGKSLQTDSNLALSTVESANVNPCDPSSSTTGKSAAGGLFGLGLLSTIAIIGGSAVAAIAVIATTGGNEAAGGSVIVSPTR